MNFFHVLLVSALLAVSSCLPADPNQPKTDGAPQGNPGMVPVGPQQPVDNYVPHATYPNADTYPNSAYDYYGMPNGVTYPQAGEYVTAMMPAANTAMQIALKIFAKIGLFLVGGVALLVVGGIFTTAVCSLTPLCTITFAGMTNLDSNTMRSFVTPDKLSEAADFVQDAVTKYKRLQRAIGN